MPSKFALCAPFAALALIAAGGSSQRSGDSVSFHVQSGTALARSFESRKESSQDEVETLLNGQPFPAGSRHGVTLIQSKLLEIVDEFTAVEGAQPKSLKRTFQKIESLGEQRTEHPMDAGERDDTVQAKSELEGKTVVFEWDEEKAQFRRRFEPEGPDEKLLAGLAEDVDFRAFLPASGQAAAEEIWNVDVKAMGAVFMPGGDLALKPTEGPEEGEDPGDMNMFDPADAFSGLEGEVTATYKGSRDIEGVSCGVIALDFKVHSNRDLSDAARKESAARGPLGDVTIDHVSAFLAVEGDAELTWDLAAGHARSFTLSAKIKKQADIGMKLTSGGKLMEILRKLELSGTYELKVAVTRR